MSSSHPPNSTASSGVSDRDGGPAKPPGRPWGFRIAAFASAVLLGSTAFLLGTVVDSCSVTPIALVAKSNIPGERGTVSGVGGIYWVGDAETGDLSQFYVGTANTDGAPGPRVVSDPQLVRDGKYALAFEIPGGGRRNEAAPLFRDIVPGDDLYFGFSTMLGDGFPVDASWQVITQWKDRGDGSPPLSLDVENGQYQIDGGFGRPGGERSFTVPIARASTGTWVDWTFHIKFSSNPRIGFFEVWMNGDLVVPKYFPTGGTLYQGLDSFVKTGYYRNPEIGQKGTLYVDDWRIGKKRDVE